ncbi:MAG: hypothetical protein M3259_01075 [Actinomycetota bacterium]|nr:hypothetical protein [Actinomycetota bacterium]
MDHFSLLESEPFHELWYWCNGLSKTDAEELYTVFSFGPQLVTPDEEGEIGDLTVTTVSFHSKLMTLLPRSSTNRQRPDGPLLYHTG